MELLIKIKNVYGNETVYPVCENSQLMCELLKVQTFTERSINILKKLGYTFTVQSQTL